VRLFIHPEFAPRASLKLDLGAVQWDLRGIDKLMDQIIFKAVGDIAGGIAGGIAGNQDKITQDAENQLGQVFSLLERNQLGAIAGGIARAGIDDKFLKVLSISTNPASRSEVLAHLILSNRAKNFETYIQPLVAMNWLTMTISEKPTSPNQKYLTTLKGRIILNFLRHK
jgi:hypothetical protein